MILIPTSVICTTHSSPVFPYTKIPSVLLSFSNPPTNRKSQIESRNQRSPFLLRSVKMVRQLCALRAYSAACRVYFLIYI